MTIFDSLRRSIPFLSGKQPTHRQVMSLRPIRNPVAKWERLAESGLVVITVPNRQDLQTKIYMRWFGVPGTRKIEMTDELSSLVWELCDGKHTVGEMSARIAKDYKLSLRQAEVSVLTFLKTLQTKHLAGVPKDQVKPAAAAEEGFYARRKRARRAAH